MGPDCGTAIVGGVPLGFANAVRRGAIGLVAASGTGLQEVTSQIHRLGGGVSQAIGTGGRDLQAEVGAVSMRQGIALLARDPGTRVIAIISKPPAPRGGRVGSGSARGGGQAGRGAVHRRACGGAASAAAPQPPLAQVGTLGRLRGAGGAPGRASVRAAAPRGGLPPAGRARASRAASAGCARCTPAAPLPPRRRRCGPAMGLEVWSNVPLADGRALPDARRASREHTVLDLGDDAFTVGRPHPMIDATARIERLLQEAADPEVRVLLLDVVIGWGAHADPAAGLAPALREAQAIARRGGRRLAVVGFVCGTDQDPQGLARQEAALRDAGMVLAGNSANAAWLAREWVR
jgi:FdrA protein